jgi:hypothetical protein
VIDAEMTLDKTFFAVRKIPEKKVTSIKKSHVIIKNINQYNLYGRQLLPFRVCAFTSSNGFLLRKYYDLEGNQIK